MHGMNNVRTIVQSTNKHVTAVTNNRGLLIRDTSYVSLYKLSFKIYCFDPADYSTIIPHCIHLKQMFVFERGDSHFLNGIITFSVLGAVSSHVFYWAC